MELGGPPLVWRWAVVSGKTQVLNSNSNSTVQDPLRTLSKVMALLFTLLRTSSHELAHSRCVPYLFVDLVKNNRILREFLIHWVRFNEIAYTCNYCKCRSCRCKLFSAGNSKHWKLKKKWLQQGTIMKCCECPVNMKICQQMS